jgi:hypothetical protein
MIDRLMIGDFIDFSPFRSGLAQQFDLRCGPALGFNPICRRLMGASAAAHDSVARAWAVLPLLPPTDDRCFFFAEGGHFLLSCRWATSVSAPDHDLARAKISCCPSQPMTACCGSVAQ